MDERLFSAASHRLCDMARQATAYTSQAGIMLHSNRGWEACVDGEQDSVTGGAHPVMLYASTVVRVMWAFAMQGCHDDPVLPLLVPHALVRAAALVTSTL